MSVTQKQLDSKLFQCGDESHDELRGNPLFEVYARHHCDLPKTTEKSKDGPKNAIRVVHDNTVNRHWIDKYHGKAKKRWGEMMHPKHKADPAPPLSVAKKSDKALEDQKELTEEGWEVLEDADVDEEADTKAFYSRKRVHSLNGGLQ